MYYKFYHYFKLSFNYLSSMEKINQEILEKVIKLFES